MTRTLALAALCAFVVANPASAQAPEHGSPGYLFNLLGQLVAVDKMMRHCDIPTRPSAIDRLAASVARVEASLNPKPGEFAQLVETSRGEVQSMLRQNGAEGCNKLATTLSNVMSTTFANFDRHYAAAPARK